jgi:hypothetical protein
MTTREELEEAVAQLQVESKAWRYLVMMLLVQYAITQPDVDRVFESLIVLADRMFERATEVGEFDSYVTDEVRKLAKEARDFAIALKSEG